jgi:hypothetical protein
VLLLLTVTLSFDSVADSINMLLKRLVIVEDKDFHYACAFVMWDIQFGR